MLIIGCGRELTERGQNIGVFWFPFTSESVSCTNEICIKAWPRASILSVTLFKNAKVPHLNLRVWNLNTHKHLSTIWYVWIPRAFLCSAYAKLYSHCSCTYVILLPALIKCIKLNVIPWRLSWPYCPLRRNSYKFIFSQSFPCIYRIQYIGFQE